MMSIFKRIGLMTLMGLMSIAGWGQAQEPELIIQAPATASSVNGAPVTPVTAPKADVATPEVKPTPTGEATPVPPPQVVPKVDHAVTNVPPPPVVPQASEVSVVPVSVVPTNGVEVSEGERFFVDTWKAPSFQVGTRVLEVKLQDTTRGTPGEGSFFGTITEISEVQDHTPDRIFIQTRLFKSPVWLGVSYDYVTARTMDDGDGDGEPDMSGGDGDMEIKGFTPYLQAAWDNETRFTPYAQVGCGFYQADFIPNAAWGDNGSRWVEATSNVMGFELGAGLGVRLYKNLSADLFAKSVKVEDITGEWHGHGSSGGPFIMTMSYVAYGAGLSCRF